jgi:hypothetical protein
MDIAEDRGARHDEPQSRVDLLTHPIPCAICGRDLTSSDGFALVAIKVTDRWTCASHDEETAF